MNNQLQIDYDLYYKQNNFSDLKRAVTTLTTVTEQQFKVIKNEKWYTRLFDCVTFSNKKNKRIALQIKSLAQAQSVLAEMLIMLSERDKQVLELLCQNTNDIQELSKICGFLANKIQYLQNSIAFGIHNAEDINELSEIGKQTLSGCLYELNSIYNGRSSTLQQEYANNIRKIIKYESTVDNLKLALETLEEKDRRLILTCCMEYIFLRMDRIMFYLRTKKFIEKFNIGNSSIKVIKNRTKATCRLIGKKGLANKYLQQKQNAEDSYEINLNTDISDELETYNEYIGLPLDFVINKKIKDIIVYFETKDYFVWNIQENWYCYDKENNKELQLSAINSDDISVFKDKKYSIDYNNNVVFYIQDDLLHRIDLLNDVNKSYANNTCDKDIILLQSQGNYVVMASPHKLYCYDIINETVFEVSDGIGTSITDTVSSTTRNLAILDESIYFSSSKGDELCDKDGANFVDVIIKYDIKNSQFTRIACAGVRDIFTSCGEIYIITDKYNNEDDYHCGWRLLKLIEQNGTYELESVIKYPYDSRVIVSENYFVYYSGYSIYAFDFRKQEIKKVVEECYKVVDVGRIRYKPERRSADFRIISNWVYFEKRGTWYRGNLNVPLSATKAVEYD